MRNATGRKEYGNKILNISGTYVKPISDQAIAIIAVTHTNAPLISFDSFFDSRLSHQ